MFHYTTATKWYRKPRGSWTSCGADFEVVSSENLFVAAGVARAVEILFQQLLQPGGLVFQDC